MPEKTIHLRGFLGALGGVILFASTGLVPGQGRVTFQNLANAYIATNSAPQGSASGLMAGPPGSYYFALFSAPSGTLDKAQFTFTGAYATNLSTAGRLFGGYPAIQGSSGQPMSFLVRGWSANIGHDYSAVTDYLANPSFAAWYGESEIGTLTPLEGEGPYPLLFGVNQLPGFTQIPGFTLGMHPIPEPSTTAFAGLMTATLLAFGRARCHQARPPNM